MRCARCGQDNPAGMRFCGGCGAPLGEVPSLPALSGAEAEAQRRYLTIMFADLVGSTAIAETLDPEDFSETLAAYYAAATKAVERFGGYLAQFQGDGVIAYFGYPRAHEDDPQRGVHAGLVLVDEVRALNEQLHARLKIDLAVRVGLHTGLALAGAVGSGPGRERHSAVGETLHIASRVQGVAEPGTVLITRSTLELLGGHFTTQPLGANELKGISQPLELFRVLGAEIDAPAARQLLPLVDRREEITRLIGVWRHAVEGRGALVHVTGEPGIGKTRIVHALRELVGEEAGAVRVLRCSPHHASTALYPVSRFLKEATGLDKQSLSEPLGRTSALAGMLGAAELDAEEVLPLLSQLLAIGDDEEPMAPLDARIALLQSLQALLIEDPAGRPLLLVVEDLHWADPTTLELLERIAGVVGRVPAVLVVTFRPDFQPPWLGWLNALEVDVGALGPEDVRTMAQSAAAGELDEEALRGLERAAEGVPLYVEEMTRTLVADTAGGRPVTRVPSTLQGLLGERLDRLPDLAGVIDAAAVLGREFDRGPAEALSSLDRAGFRSAIARLTAEDVLRPVEGSRSRLEFRHSLLQEAAYDRLLRSRRRSLHAQAAELMIAHGPADSDFEAEHIARHLSLAGQPAKALAYWELAGKRARRQAAFLEAADHFRNGLQALDECRPGVEGDAERGEMLAEQGMALQAGLTPSTDVREIFEGARDAYARAGVNDERLLPLYRGQYLQRIGRAEYDAAKSLGEELLALAEDTDRGAWVAEGHFNRGFIHMMTGNLEAARMDLERAIDLGDRERRQHVRESQADPRVAAAGYLAPVLWKLGRTREAFEHGDLCMNLAEELGGPVTLGLALGLRGALLMVAGQLSEFEGWVNRARTYCVERNIGYWRDFCTMWSTWLDGHTADPARNARLLAQQLDGYVASGSRVGLPHLQSMLADLYLLAEMREHALDILAAGLEHIETANEHYYEPEVNWMLARALMSGPEPDPAGADAAYERAMLVCREQHARLSELHAATLLAAHRSRTGEPGEEVLERLAELYGTFEDQPELADVRRARAVLGERAPRT